MPNQDKDFFDKIYKMWDEGEHADDGLARV